MAQQVQGKTAIVTGAGSGINLEFARLLLQEGANVLFADLSLRPEAQELVDKYAPRAVFLATDVSSWPALDLMFTTAVAKFGQVDIVCPGAGIFEPHWSNFWYPPGKAPSKDAPDSGRYATLDINLTHPIRVTQLALSHFLAQSPPPGPTNPKSIVHIASIAGESTSLPFPLYHVSKHGVQALVRSLADLEGLHGIRVTCLMPGVVKTPLWTEHPEKLKIVDTERDEWVTPEEVAGVMLSCVRDTRIARDLRTGTGETIDIAGGTCLEVLSGSVRDVPAFGNMGPYTADGARGATVSDAEKIYTEVTGLLKPGWGEVPKA